MIFLRITHILSLFILSALSVTLMAESAESVYADSCSTDSLNVTCYMLHQPKHIYSIGGSGGIDHLLNVKVRGEKLVKRGWGSSYNVFMNSQANPLDREISVYDRVFGFPTLEAGIQLQDLSHTRLHTGETPYMSVVGMIWSGYIGFRRDIYRNRRWAYGYGLYNGISLSSRTYEGENNVDDDLVGQHLSVYFGLDLFASYRITPRDELSLQFGYKHVSNGATDRPNKGANTYGLAVRARHDLNRPDADKGMTFDERQARLQAFKREAFVPYAYLDINGLVGFRTMYEEFILRRSYLAPDEPGYLDGKLALHTVWGTNVVQMFRYNQVHASGLGLEYMFAGYAGRSGLIEHECAIRAPESDFADGYKHSKHVLAIAGYHEVYYKQLSLQMSFGTYLFRRLGWVSKHYEAPVYETVGIRYYPKFFKPFYIGYNVKANLGKAYDMEIKVGLHAGRWNLKKTKKE